MIVATRLSQAGDAKCDSRPAVARRMALIDRHGKIVAVNDDWMALAKQTRARSTRIGVGADYLDVCRRASNFSLSSHIALNGICQVLNEETPSFSMDYTCDTPAGLGYFRMIATPIHYKNARVAVCHTDISDLELSRLKEFDRVQKFATRIDQCPGGRAAADFTRNTRRSGRQDRVSGILHPPVA